MKNGIIQNLAVPPPLLKPPEASLHTATGRSLLAKTPWSCTRGIHIAALDDFDSAKAEEREAEWMF